jgi:hypothetical protein
LENKLSKIFEFMHKNSQYNKMIQQKCYYEAIQPYEQKVDKAESMLWKVAYSQSQPNINKLAPFWKLVHENKKLLESFNGLNELFDKSSRSKESKSNINKSYNYNTLFNNIRTTDGWGDKTAALLCKELYLLHNSDLGDEYKIWNDASSITSDDKLYLPVDAVIIFIFNGLDPQLKNFKSINNKINKLYTGVNEIIIWDDLWFWGFITQNSSRDNVNEEQDNGRRLEWNENKYWGLRHVPKDKDTIETIKKLAQEFIKILKECGWRYR